MSYFGVPLTTERVKALTGVTSQEDVNKLSVKIDNDRYLNQLGCSIVAMIARDLPRSSHKWVMVQGP